jgi:hypothetical protein
MKNAVSVLEACEVAVRNVFYSLEKKDPSGDK